MEFKLDITGKLPFIGRKAAPEAEAQSAAKPASQSTGAPARAKRAMLARPIPLIGRLGTGRQLQILIGLLIALLLADAGVVYYDNRQGTFGTIYIATVGKVRMLSQRLGNAAQQASLGNLE